jgi:hypothetical protein
MDNCKFTISYILTGYEYNFKHFRPNRPIQINNYSQYLLALIYTIIYIYNNKQWDAANA